MNRNRLMRPWLVALMCLALLGARVSGAHLHLCFDGSEAPASFLLADDGVHHAEPGVSAHHQDTDVSASGDVLTKSAKSTPDLPLFLLAALLALAFPKPPFRFGARRAHTTPPAAAAYLRPPLRGPPPLISP